MVLQYTGIIMILSFGLYIYILSDFSNLPYVIGLIPRRVVKVNTGSDPCWAELSKYIRLKAPTGKWNINTPLMIRKYNLTWGWTQDYDLPIGIMKYLFS